MYSICLRSSFVHLRRLSSMKRTLSSTAIPSNSAEIVQEEIRPGSFNSSTISDPLLNSIQSCASIATLFPLVRSQLQKQKAHHIVAALLRACHIVRSCTYLHPTQMENYQKKLLTHPMFDLLCHLCEHRLHELNFQDSINILSALVKLDIRLISSESPFLRNLFTALSQTDYIDQLDLTLLHRYMVALVKKSNRHLLFPLYKPLFDRFRQLLIDVEANPDALTIKNIIGIVHLLSSAIPFSNSHQDAMQIVPLVTKILDENLERISHDAPVDTFTRLCSLGPMFTDSISRWMIPVSRFWADRLNQIIWFDLYLILSSARKNFFPLKDLYEFATMRCEYELDRNLSRTNQDLLYMVCALYRQAKSPLRLRLNKRLNMFIDDFDLHSVSILFQHVNPDSCNDTDLLVKIHQKLKKITLSKSENEFDFWSILDVLTEYITRNVDYYTTESIGADLILHMRSEIERGKTRENHTWLLRDQYLPILTFYLKFALSGTAIPRNIMNNADAMIAQASLRHTGTLLSGYHHAVTSLSPIASNITFQRQIEQIHQMIVQYKKDHLTNLSIYPFSHLVNFLNHVISSRQSIGTPLFEPFFERLNSLDNQTSLSLRDIHNLSSLFMNSGRLYPSVLDAMCSTMIETPATPLKLIATYFRCLFKINYKPEQISDLCSLARHLYENNDEVRPIDMLWLALASAGTLNQLDEKLVQDIFSFDFLEDIDQITSRKTAFHFGQPLFRLNQIVVIDYPELNIPWFNDQFALDFVLSDARRYWSTRQNSFEQIESAIATILGGKEFLHRNTFSPYFHDIDFECVLQLGTNQPVRCERFDIAKDIEGTKKLQIPDGCERLAIQIVTANDFCYNTTNLVGSVDIKHRHLKKLGYRVVVIPHYELSSIDSTVARFRYLKKKLFNNTP